VGEEGERFRESDLRELLENGHELASHTFDHVSARSMPARAFEAEVDRGRAAVEVFHDAASANFAYPFGDVTLATKRIVGRSVASARGIFPGINRGEADLNLLRANSLYGDVEVLPWAQTLIRENIECAGWLIFYTHDVQPRPSRYGCTPELLQAVVGYAAERGLEMLTVQQALESIGVPNGQPARQAARSVSA
jgi:peptidoglycan/xylan/chitin deacetylase (PgdA/CDA1 family)